MYINVSVNKREKGVCGCTLYATRIVNEHGDGLSGWFVQDDVSAQGWGLGEACRGWGDTYQILLTQLPELLELLGHQQLGTPHCTADLPQDCRKKKNHTGAHVSARARTRDTITHILPHTAGALQRLTGNAAFVMQQKKTPLWSHLEGTELI